MNVCLAAQTLGSSVSLSLKFCEQLKVLKGTRATSKFCEIFNDAFDITNCRNKLAKGTTLHSMIKLYQKYSHFWKN